MSLFGKKSKPTFTNAPPHWPKLSVTSWVPGNPALALLEIAATLAKGLPDAKLTFFDDRLYDEGVLRLPLVVEEGGKRTAVFAYPDAGPEAAGLYSGLRTLLRQREQINAVYYATESIQPSKPATVVEPLDTPHFERPEEERPPAEYALWWPTPEEPRLTDSPALAHLDRWFEALDGHAWTLLTSFVKGLELQPSEEQARGGQADEKKADTGKAEEDPLRLVGLPQQPLLAPVDGPAHLKLYLHASLAEGLWLAFHTQETTVALRNRLLKLLADFASGVQQAVVEEQVPANEDEQGVALAFWRETREDLLRREAAGVEGLMLGRIAEEGSLRVRQPGVSAPAEREGDRTANAASEALIELARQGLAAAFESMGSGPTPEGGPALHPFVTTLRGAELLRTTLHFHLEPEAVAACPGVVAEHGEVERVVLVCDGYFRLNGERFDALIARAQERGTATSHTFVQRYRATEKEGLEQLGSWVHAGLGEALCPTSPEGHAPPPVPPTDEERHFVQAILKETLRWIEIGGDGSGAELYREGQPLFSPSLQVQVGDERLTKRFVLGVAGTSFGWVLNAVGQALQEQPEARLAVFVSDDVTTLDGQAARSLRLRVQARGTARAWVFAQAYEVPKKGRPFLTSGRFEPLRPAPPLFPA